MGHGTKERGVATQTQYSSADMTHHAGNMASQAWLGSDNAQQSALTALGSPLGGQVLPGAPPAHAVLAHRGCGRRTAAKLARAPSHNLPLPSTWTERVGRNDVGCMQCLALPPGACVKRHMTALSALRILPLSSLALLTQPAYATCLCNLHTHLFSHPVTCDMEVWVIAGLRWGWRPAKRRHSCCLVWRHGHLRHAPRRHAPLRHARPRGHGSVHASRRHGAVRSSRRHSAVRASRRHAGGRRPWHHVVHRCRRPRRGSCRRRRAGCALRGSAGGEVAAALARPDG